MTLCSPHYSKDNKTTVHRFIDLSQAKRLQKSDNILHARTMPYYRFAERPIIRSLLLVRSDKGLATDIYRPKRAIYLSLTLVGSQPVGDKGNGGQSRAIVLPAISLS